MTDDQRVEATYQKMLRVGEESERAYRRIIEFERAKTRDEWVINIITFLLCFPLAWLLAKVMP